MAIDFFKRGEAFIESEEVDVYPSSHKWTLFH